MFDEFAYRCGFAMRLQANRTLPRLLQDVIAFILEYCLERSRRGSFHRHPAFQSYYRVVTRTMAMQCLSEPDPKKAFFTSILDRLNSKPSNIAFAVREAALNVMKECLRTGFGKKIAIFGPHLEPIVPVRNTNDRPHQQFQSISIIHPADPSEWLTYVEPLFKKHQMTIQRWAWMLFHTISKKAIRFNNYFVSRNDHWQRQQTGRTYQEGVRVCVQ